MSKPVTERKSHLSLLTGLRGYAALWVVIYHFKGNAGIAGVIDLGPLAYHGAWGVEIFFVLSGFVLSYVYESAFKEQFNSRVYFKYLLLRLGRIYPLHVMLLLFFALLVFGGSQFGISPAHPENFKVADLGWNMLLLHAWGVTDPLNWNYVSWSISAEWFAYLFLLPLYVFLGRRLSPVQLLVIATLSWLIFFVFGATEQDWSYRDQYESALWRISNDFFWGYALYRFWKQHEFKALLANAMLLVSVATIICLAYASGPWRVLLLPAVAIFILSMASGAPLGAWFCANKVAILMGEISYAIYMTHPAVQVMSNAIVRRLSLETGATTAIFILVLDVVAVLIVSAIAYFVIEHPCREWVRRRLT